MGRGKPDTADAVKDRIRGAGLRCTAARVAVLQHLETAPGPLTHAEVSEALHHLGFDRATIYRNLTELTEAKLAARVELVCTTCGEVSCLDDVQVAITPRSAAGKSAPGPKRAGRSPAASRRIGSVTEILLKGRCEQCE
jgi:Fur family ferric uptake transcriptional regulator